MKNFTTTLILVLTINLSWAQSQAPIKLNSKLLPQVTNQSTLAGSKSLLQTDAKTDSINKVLEKYKSVIAERSPKRNLVRSQKTDANKPKLKVVSKQQSNESAEGVQNLAIGNDVVKHLKDDPTARLEFEILKTKDPITGKIPQNIRFKETEYMKIQNEKIGIPLGLGDISSPWVNRGPHNVGGRTRALAVDTNDENIIMAGGVSGGMWRSADQGATWAKTTGTNELQSVTCIAQDTRSGQTDTWYYGTGEISGNSAGAPGGSYRGDGIYKSVDNGLTWSLLSVTSTDTPEAFDQGFDYNYEIVVNPTNGDVLVSNYEGVYLSSDGGISFTLVLSNTNDTGFWGDIIMTSAGKAFAVIDDKGVYSSVDGTNWTDISPLTDYPLVNGERKELALASSNENIFYLLGEDVSTTSGHNLFRYDDGTGTWTNLSANIPQLGGLTGNFTSQGGYDLLIKVKPDNENFVVIGGTNLFASTDGFSSTTNTSWIGGYTANNDSYGLYKNHHPDQHSFVFLSNNRALSGNDGGVQLTNDITDITTNGDSETVDWTWLNNGYLTSQVYALSAGPGDQIMAGFQDNSTWLTTSLNSDATWTDQFGGDGAYNAFNSDGSVRYMSSQNGNIYRVNYTDGADDITADGFTQFNPDGYSAGLFIVPFYLDPLNDDIFYLAGSSTFYVNTQASTGSSSTGWKTIDLGATGTISEIGVTSHNIVYVGTSTGEVFRIEDPAGSESVIDVTGTNFPSGYVSGLGVNSTNSDELVITFSNYSIQSVFHSLDGGASWTDVGGNLEENPDGSGSGPSVRSAQILGSSDRYFIGTSTGLYSTTSLSGNSTIWVQENGSGIGNVVVEHLVARHSDGLLLAGTHGNGIYSAKFEASGQPENDLAVTGISAPSELVSGVESITVSVKNVGTNDQVSGFDLAYFVNDIEIASETVTDNVLVGEDLNHTFSTTYDFSVEGEYEIRVELTLANDEVATNNSFSKNVVNAMFTGNYVLQQLEPTTVGTSAAYANGYLFSTSGLNLIQVKYIDADTRGTIGLYLPQYNSSFQFFQWTMTNGEVAFLDNQSTGVGCVGDILLGTADTPGSYSESDDNQFTLTIKEDLADDCGVGTGDVAFSLVRQQTNDLAVVSIGSPANQSYNGLHPIMITLFNLGSEAQEGFEVSYSVNGESTITEVVSESIPSGGIFHHTFTEKYEFATAGVYEVTATVNLTGDEDTTNDALIRNIDIIQLLGFEGPYLLEQLAPNTVGPSAGFDNGYLFSSSMLNEIFIENLGGRDRSFSANYLAPFNASFKDYSFSLIGSETFFGDSQSTNIGCGENILLSTADIPGNFDINDDSAFTLNIKEIDPSCQTGTGDVEFKLTKQDPYHDVAIIDISSPGNIFPSSEQTIQIWVHNYSNVRQENFEVTYYVNDELISTEIITQQINPKQSISFNFEITHDFSTPGFYDLKAETKLVGDEFPDNDSFTKTVESLAPIASFPYVESFEDDGGNFPIGWNGNWQLTNLGSTDPSTGPVGDNTLGNGFYANSVGQYYYTNQLYSRHIDLSSLNSPLLSFNYHMYGTPQTTFEVWIVSEANGTRPVFSVSGSQQTSQNEHYREASINLSAYANQTIQLLFQEVNPGSVPAIVAIDDIRVKEAAEHDLAIRTIMSPANIVSGEEAITITLVNLGKRAQTEFEVSYFVDDILISTEVVNDVITAGSNIDFTFNTTHDFASSGNYILRTEVDLPTDEVATNNSYSREVTKPGERIAFTGAYQMEQQGQTSGSVSGTYANGHLFSSSNIIDVDLQFVDETTRSLSLAYLTEYGTIVRDYQFQLSNGEVVFFDNQGTGQVLCSANEILLGTADVPGSFDVNNDSFFYITIKEDVTNDCGVGTEDVTFLLNKKAGNFDYDLAIVNINTPQKDIPLSRQAISFQIQNEGKLPQGDFDATYFVDDVAIATETFFQPFKIQSGNGQNLTFTTPYEFGALKVYDIRVALTRASDDNPINDETTIQVQTSPFNINAIPISNTRIGIEWVNLVSVTDVVLERTIDNGEFIDLANIASDETFFIDDAVDEITFYSYRLRGTLPEGGTAYSVVVFAQATLSGEFAFDKVLGDITGVDLSNNTYSSSWGDLDDDGDLDMVVSNVPNFNLNLSILDQPTIFINDGFGNFEKALGTTVVNDGVSSRSASLIDYNNDGKVDVYLPALNSRIGDHRERLFENNGSMDFTSVNVPGFEINNTSSTEDGVWGDMDNDGDLDLFLAGQFWGGNVNFLFENLGDGRLKSIKSGVIYESMFNSGMLTWTASWVDYDGDGDQDLFVPDNNGSAKMFRNLENTGFEEVLDLPFVTEFIRVRGAHWADFDQDGSLDLMMIDLDNGPTFFFNDGVGSFTKKTSMEAFGSQLNIHRISSVGDINNNGKLDVIFASNGYFVYESNNDQTFTVLDNILPPTGSEAQFAGISFGDMDNDGDLDMFRGNASSGNPFNFLYRNKGNSNNWLHIELDGEFSNADGIGAKIELISASGTQYRTITSSTGLMGQNSLIAEFGLGSDAKADHVKVYWPSGTVKELFDVDANQLYKINDSNAPTDLGLSNSGLPENLGNGTAVGASFSVDNDSEDLFTYSIVGGGGIAGGANNYTGVGQFGNTSLLSPVINGVSMESAGLDNAQILEDGDNFTIDENGTIKGNGEFDFETQPSYSIRVRSTDSFGNTFEKVIQIDILDVNEDIENSAPSDITLSGNRINENEQQGSIIGTLSATDTDEGSTHTYSLVDGDANLFFIEGDVLKTTSAFNYEKKPEYTITIRTIDDGGLSLDKSYTISVDNVNEEPIELFLDNTKLTEELVAGSLIGELTTSDTDNDDNHTYTLSGADAASFQISGNELRSNEKFDFETKANYELTVTSTDEGGLAISDSYEIQIDNANDAPEGLEITKTSIDELLPKGSVVGDLSTIDDDPNDNHTYVLSGTDAAKFKIVLNELRTAEKFDFESKNQYEISITVTDNSGLSYAKDYLINIDDANDSPSVLNLSNSEIPEELVAGSTVGSLTTADQDISDVHAYTLVSGTGDTDNASFTIDGSTLKSAVQFDFETKTSYSVRVNVSDGKGGNLENQFTVTIKDIDETSPNSSPTNINITGTNISENETAGSTVGTLSTIDVDAGDTHLYTIVNGDASLFNISDDVLETSVPLNFELGTSYNLTIRSTDAGGLIYDQEFTIIVNDVNEAPSSLTVSNKTLSEDANSGTTIGSFTTIDDDANDTHSYVISGADASSFQLGSNNELQSAVAFDFETQSTFGITITVSDLGGLDYSQDFTISVTDVNEAPTNVSIDNSNLSEGLTSGSVVGIFSTIDTDANESQTYTLSGTDASKFTVVIDELRSTEKFNFEDVSSYSVTVTSTDKGGLTTSANLTIDIVDVNEAPTALLLDNTEILEGESAGSAIGTFTISDEDASDTHTYTIEGIDAASFDIVGNELQTTVEFNFELKSNYNLTVIASDLGGLSVANDLVVTVSNINEAPTSLAVSNDAIDEGLTSGTVIGLIDFEDEDASDTHIISLSGADASSFQIVGNELQSATEFNFENQATMSIDVIVTDAGGLDDTESYTIKVNDVNEAPTAIELSHAEIDEGNDIGAIIGSLTVTDEDTNDSHTFMLSGTDAASFEIVNGELISKESFDFDVKSSYAVTIEASDSEFTTSDDFTVSISMVLSFDEDDRLVKVYPNPSSGIFTIELDAAWRNATWELLDLNGKLVQTTNNVVKISNFAVQVDVNNLPNGQYILKLSNDNKEITKQLIISK